MLWAKVRSEVRMLFNVPQASLLIFPSESGILCSNPEEKLKQPSILQQNPDNNLCFVSSDDSQRHLWEKRCYSPAGISSRGMHKCRWGYCTAAACIQTHNTVRAGVMIGCWFNAGLPLTSQPFPFSKVEMGCWRKQLPLIIFPLTMCYHMWKVLTCRALGGNV